MLRHGAAILVTALASLLAGPLAWAQGSPAETASSSSPRLLPSQGGLLRVTDLPRILADEEVARHLTTGLTTTFVFRLEVNRGKARGGARVEIRYELWDEVFQTLAFGIDGRPERGQQNSLEELHRWWERLQLAVLDTRGQPVEAGSRVRLEVDVVPFSQAERDDTERWLYDSARRSGGARSQRRPGAPEIEPNSSRGSLEQVFSVLIATSLRSRAVTSFRWNLTVPPPEVNP